MPHPRPRTTLFFVIIYNLLILSVLQNAQNRGRTTAKFAYVRKKQYLCTRFLKHDFDCKISKTF